jgi:O-antigen ligase
VLKGALQSIWPANIKLAHISLLLIGLMWVFPFLYYRHENPLTTFDQEWWCALLGLLALTLLIASDYWQRPEIPRIAQLPAALIGIVLLQVTLGKVAYFDQALLYILYLLFASLLMLLGARLRAYFGIETLSAALALFLLIGAELSAFIGVLQHYKWHTLFDAVVVMQTSPGIYGNLAQPNHFADYIALGLASLGLLFQQRKLNPAYVFLLAVPLLFVLTLSGSRSSLLYLLLMVLLAWWSSHRNIKTRALLVYSAMLLAGFGLMQLIVQIPFLYGSANDTTSVQRLLAYNSGGDTSGSIRLYLWREAWLMFTQSPLLGVGFGQFSWHHFQLLPSLKASYISGLYNNAHNLVFQFAAEAGIAGLAALFVSLGIWINGLRRVPPSASLWWGSAVLGVLAIHSLLEYPMWYTYFLAIAAVLMGTFDETRYRFAQHQFWRFSLALILFLGLLSLIQMRHGYQKLKDTLSIPISSENSKSRLRDGLLSIQHGGSLLSPYAEEIFLLYADVNPDYIKQKLALGSNVMHFAPTANAVYRQAFFLAQDGQLDRAKQLLEKAIWSYPDDSDSQQLLQNLSRKDPAHFSALLEFYLQKEQERVRAVRHR